MLGASPGESSAAVAARVVAVRAVSMARSGGLNAALDGDALDRFAPLDAAALALLRARMESGRLSGRGYHRVRRVARTIADLDGVSGAVGEEHVAAALALRAELRRAGVGVPA
jgi:magnesium chelatase family protein